MRQRQRQPQKAKNKPKGIEKSRGRQVKTCLPLFFTRATSQSLCLHKTLATAASGADGSFSTLSDLMSFVEAYLQRDGRLFSEGMFQTILDTTFKERGLGWNKEYGNHILYHTGFTGTSILMDMDTREGMILLTNRIHPSRDNKVFLEERIALNHLWLD